MNENEQQDVQPDVEQQPTPEVPEQPADKPAETTDAGDGSEDVPTDDEKAMEQDVELEAPGPHESSPGYGVTEKFPSQDDAAPPAPEQQP